MEDWRPGASQGLLQARAGLLADIRQFFAAREVLEVETPLLCSTGATDPALQLFASAGRVLQTSPEYAMKRLLAAGSGPIFQVCKAFRAAEQGRLHNPEFSLLEWYRPGWDYRQLLAEVAELLAGLLDCSGYRETRYRELFLDQLQVDPFVAGEEELAALARRRLDLNFTAVDRDGWLDLLMTHCIEPGLPGGMCFVTDYPASQAALARVVNRDDGAAYAERFELYVDGIELANGYTELNDPHELAARLEGERRRLAQAGLPDRELDAALLAATRSGVADCAGVALGLDRLLLIQQGCRSLDEVLSFSWSRA
jgi:lysyl-tRNA synthetase class 2